MKDWKISTKELEKDGLIVDDIQIMKPTLEKTMAQLRSKRRVPFYKIAGNVYYSAVELSEWVKSQKVEVI